MFDFVDAIRYQMPLAEHQTPGCNEVHDDDDDDDEEMMMMIGDGNESQV